MSKIKVISGCYGGRFIDTIEGVKTRPTSSRAKEAIFSAITSLRASCGGFKGARVLDLFAGSGALGIESLSRGAVFSLFCEINNVAMKTISNNLKSLGIDEDCYGTLRKNSFSKEALDEIAQRKPFDIVFLDPPYSIESDNIISLIETLQNRDVVSQKTLIYLERRSCDLEEVADYNLEVLYKKKFGEVGCLIFRLNQ